MSEFDDQHEDILKRGLGEMFDNFEPDVSSPLRDRVFRALPQRWPKLPWWVAGAMLSVLLLVWYSLEVGDKRASTREPVLASQQRKAATRHKQRQSGHSRKKLFPPGDSLRTVRGESSNFPGAVTSVYPKAEPPTQTHRRIAPEAKQVIAPLVQSADDDSQAGRGNNLASETIQEARTLPAKSASLADEGNLIRNHFDIHGIASRTALLKLPQVEWQVQQPSKQVSSPLPSPMRWLVTVTPLQYFQRLTVHSSSEVGIENVRFSPVSSLDSKGIKISAGIEKSGMQLLVNYSYLTSSMSYSLGKNRFVVKPGTSGSYEIVRETVSRTLDQQMHVVGVGLRKVESFRIARRNYIVGTGLEFDRILPAGQNLIQVNLGLSRKFVLKSDVSLSVGPYMELGLNQRYIIPGIWKSRPYQLGVSINIQKGK